MEKSQNIDIVDRPKDKDREWGGANPGCPFFFFGDDDSAKNDLSKAVDIVDNEKVKTNK